MRVCTRVIYLLVVLIGILALSACGDGKFADELPVPNVTMEPAEPELEPEVIERSSDARNDHLAIRILRVGHVIEPGVKMSMEHRGEIQLEVGPDGEIDDFGHGYGEEINDGSPYTFEICRYDMQFRVEGKLKLPNCVLELTLFEEILGGDCTHHDPNNTISYPYAAWGAEDQLDSFTFPAIHGTDTYEWESDELVGKIHWVDQLQVWIIKDLPICSFEQDTAAPPPTLEPWYTPTWQP
jgi:hypothetical protein